MGIDYDPLNPLHYLKHLQAQIGYRNGYCIYLSKEEMQRLEDVIAFNEGREPANYLNTKENVKQPIDTGVALLSAASRSGDPIAISLAARLANAQPCKECGFVWFHCRCPSKTSQPLPKEQ